MANVAVISANALLARFFELELTNMGINVSVISKEEPIALDFDFVILDTDTVNKLREIYSCPVVTVSCDQTDGENKYHLPWPATIDSIKELCRLINDGEPPKNDFTAPRRDGVLRIVDREDPTVSLDDRRIKLTKSELIILELLCEARGATVSRESIMERLGAVDGNISDVYICHLRKKLEADSGKRLIFTVRGQGYRIAHELLK